MKELIGDDSSSDSDETVKNTSRRMDDIDDIDTERLKSIIGGGPGVQVTTRMSISA